VIIRADFRLFPMREDKRLYRQWLEMGFIQVAEISLPRLYSENSDMLEAVEVDATIALGPSKGEDFNDPRRKRHGG
jgi:hypothetical protein